MNSQREVVYKRRRHALDGVRLQVDISNMIYDMLKSIVIENKKADNFENFEYELIKFSSTASPVDAVEFKSISERDLINKLYESIQSNYKGKIERNAIAAYPVIKNVYEREGNRFERISVPFTDGIKTLNVVTNLKSAYETQGKQLVTDFEQNITLAIIDDNWKEHLRRMDELKTYVQNAAYEQKDPLLIYKFEAYELFRTMIDETNKEVVSFLFKGDLPSKSPDQVQQAREQKQEKVQLSKAEFNQDSMQTNQTQAPQVTETIHREQPKVGRNEKVIIKNVLTGATKEVKFKQAIPLLESGEWVTV
jgi:preprotein translocase subunit SecA